MNPGNTHPQATTDSRYPIVDREVEAWRRAGLEGREGLSSGARSRILSATRARADRFPRLSALFAPTQRLALVGIVPALLLSVTVGLLALPALTPALISDDVGSSSLSIQASKQGDDVIFVLANGQRSHRVYRSSTPEARVVSEAYTTARGAFRDRLDSGGELVFYRID